jgi:pyruvate/2-oxoglutarate dehydrogenase complex dihydrolipoamide dehydrogenase (E3) component
MPNSTVAVLGGGSAGFTAARTAAKLGAKVLFFMGDNADAASLCVNRGCMPSKAMFQPIDTMHHARRQRWLRVEPLVPEQYLTQIVAWKDREIARFRAYRQRAIEDHAGDNFVIVRADARFLDPHTLEAEGQRYEFDAAVIATGSTPLLPPIEGIDAVRDQVWGSDQFVSNTDGRSR